MLSKIRWWLIERLLQYEMLDVKELNPTDRYNLGLLYEDDYFRSLRKLKAKDMSDLGKQALISQSMRDVDVAKGQARTWIRLEVTLRRMNNEVKQKRKKGKG